MMGVLTDRQNTLDETGSIDEREQDENDSPIIMLPSVPENCGPQTVSLTTLLDFAINTTNRDFHILTELIQKKSEVERKGPILEFANSTRAIYLKLYALVKWVKDSKRFNSLANICYVLDQLSDCFVETADYFVQISREELVFARLPLLQISQAVDVLSLGTLPRLPEAIKTAFIPEPGLSTRQKKLTLKWMENMLNYRLVQESAFIPCGFSEIKIENGMAIFTAPNRFAVHMILEPTDTMSEEFDGDAELIKWRWMVQKVEILVADFEIGFGSSLLHPIHNLQLVDFCNQRLKHKSYDIQTVYEILHDFTLKLQLDILFCQAQHLSKTVSDTYVSVEVYDAQKGLLSILYWINDSLPFSVPYRITIERQLISQFDELILRHHPFNGMLPKLNVNKEAVNFQTLFSKTIMFRCRERLSKVKHIMKLSTTKSACVRLIGDAAIRLTYSLLNYTDSSVDEALNVAINTFTGKIQCNVPILFDDKPNALIDLEHLFESSQPFDPRKVLELLRELQILLLVKRYEVATASFQFRQVTSNEIPITEKLNGLPKTRIYLQFIEEPQYYLIITLELYQETNPDLKLFLIDFAPSKITMVELGMEDLIRSSAIADLDKSEVDIRYDYETMFGYQSFARHAKLLQIAISTVADRILFIRIAEELRKHQIQFEAPVCEPLVGGYIMRLTDVSSITEKKSHDILDNFVKCCIRWSSISRVWPFECTLKNIPLVTDYKKSEKEIKEQKNGFWTHVEEINPWQPSITALSDAIFAHVVDRLKIYTNMITAVSEFSIAYDQYFNQYCNVYIFNYHKLVLLYGPNRDKICIFSWKPRMNGFLLNFAQNEPDQKIPSSNNSYWNPHAFVYDVLSNKYNKNHDLVNLVNYLVNTDRIMQCIFNFTNPELRTLKSYSMLIENDDKNMPIEINSHIVALSEYWIRMCFGVTYVDFQLLSENRCAIQATRLKELNIQSENNEYIQLPFFKEFWNCLSGGKALYLRNSLNITESDGRPLSVPQKLMPSPNNPFGPLSCPPQVDVFLSNGKLANEIANDESSSSSLLSRVVVDAPTFEKAMSRTELGKPSLFETYLHGVTFLARLGPALESLWRSTPPRSNIPFSNYNYNSRSIRFEIAGVPFVNTNTPPWNVGMRIYLCAYTFKVKCKLGISGPTVPVETDIQLFESFFENAVAPLANEFAVLSFLSICRICSLPVFVAFGRLMQAHMESMNHHGTNHPQITGLSNLWCVMMQLVTNKDRVQSGIMLHEKTVIITLNLHSIRPRKGDKFETKQIILQYNVESNQMSSKCYYQQPEVGRQDQAAIEMLIQEATMTIRNECLIWPCIRRIVENFRSIR